MRGREIQQWMTPLGCLELPVRMSYEGGLEGLGLPGSCSRADKLRRCMCTVGGGCEHVCVCDGGMRWWDA